MTSASTTIRVSVDQRDQLRRLAAQRNASMTATLDAALETLRRNQFYREMAESEKRLRDSPADWAAYTTERDAWLNADLGEPA